MVAEQIEARGVRDRRVLDALVRVPREQFMPDEQRGERLRRIVPVPIGYGQTISQPYIVGYMTEALKLEPSHRVLEIGTGCGYQTAVLAELAGEVYSIELIAALAERARRTLDSLGYANVHVRVGDGYAGWPEHAPFDRILGRGGAAARFRRRCSNSSRTEASSSFRSASTTRNSGAAETRGRGSSCCRRCRCASCRWSVSPKPLAVSREPSRCSRARCRPAAPGLVHRHRGSRRPRERGPTPARSASRAESDRSSRKAPACAGVSSPRPTAASTPTSRRTIRQRKWDPTMRTSTRSPSSTISSRSTRTRVDFSPGSSAVNEA